MTIVKSGIIKRNKGIFQEIYIKKKVELPKGRITFL